MPTYEYSCPTCGVFECRQSFKDAALERCPSCGSPVKRIISRNVNIIYRSSGFYVSDHRSADYKSRASEDGGSSAASTGGKSAE